MARAWTPDLTVGDPTIDSQHQELFRRCTALGGALSGGEGKQRVGELLGYIAAYTVSHFRDEEVLMANARFPALAAHRTLHADLVRDVRQVQAQYAQDGARVGLVIQFNNRFAEWLVAHLVGPDMEFARFRAAAPSSLGRTASAQGPRDPAPTSSIRGAPPPSIRNPVPPSLRQPAPPSARLASSPQPSAPPRLGPPLPPVRAPMPAPSIRSASVAPATRRSPALLTPEPRPMPSNRGPRPA